MPISLPNLPYQKDALEPYISSRTLEFHYDKHHQAYVDKTNQLLKETAVKDLSLEEIIKETAHQPDQRALFNNAAQAWNHSFFWNCLKPGGGGKPSGKAAERIERDLGGYENFVKEFKATATGQFGSGWAWLILQGTELAITKTSNADTPLKNGLIPLLTVDVWEHAYYLDYQNRRADYLQAIIDHLINWDFINDTLDNYLQ